MVPLPAVAVTEIAVAELPRHTDCAVVVGCALIEGDALMVIAVLLEPVKEGLLLITRII